MIDPEHARAQQFAPDAEAAALAGDVEKAQQLYGFAAELESRVFERVPSEKVRTASILGVSLAALQFKAGNFDQAEVICRDLLINRELLPGARAELLDILAAIPRPVRARG